MILKDSFKLIKKITKRKNLPFKTLQNKTELFNIFKINSISILKEKKQLILLYYKIRCYFLNGNTLETILSHESNEGQLNACVNNKDKEIIITKQKCIF
jgi:hypothetical protein